MRKIAILLFFILFSAPCLSQPLYQYGITAEIYDNDTVNYKLNLIFVDHADQTFNLSIASPNSVIIESNTDCDVQNGLLETKVICFLKAANRSNVIISYSSDQKVTSKNGYYLFSDSFKMNMPADLVPILIKMPEGTGLRKPVENSYSPDNALIGSDGRRTIVNWEMKNIEADQRIDVSIAFERIGNIIISEIPTQILFLAVLFIVVAGAAAFYFFYLRNRRVKLILPILKKDEKKIFDTIMKNGDGKTVNQKIIVEQSGYSKAKVSKVLKSLEERGILKIERIGRKNKIHINSNFQNKTQKESGNG
jgi:uncharacterized membrane protein